MLISAILSYPHCYTKNAGNKLKYAVSNRFYDGMIYHIPQVVENDGFKPEWANSSGIGTSIELDGNFADNLYAYYLNIDAEEFDKACDECLQTVISEDDSYVDHIDSFLKN